MTDGIDGAEVLLTCARWALEGVHREYPNGVLRALSSDADLEPPRVRTPAFFGCYDWHSAVHSHWSMVRMVRFFETEDWFADAAGNCRAALAQSLTEENLAAEAAHLERPESGGFELPYGLAWLLQLGAELREWDDPDANEWSSRVEPLETIARDRFMHWLPRLPFPIRSGQHGQTAFSLGLAMDAAVVAADAEFHALLAERAFAFYDGDRDGPFHLEPSGWDFLSPVLAEADLMRRVLEFDDFNDWFCDFLPIMDEDLPEILTPVEIGEVCDGRLSHLAGLNLSRAWMLKGVALHLDDHLQDAFETLSEAYRLHAAAGLEAVRGDDYSLSHWLGSFAVYMLTDRGLTTASSSQPDA